MYKTEKEKVEILIKTFQQLRSYIYFDPRFINNQSTTKAKYNYLILRQHNTLLDSYITIFGLLFA